MSEPSETTLNKLLRNDEIGILYVIELSDDLLPEEACSLLKIGFTRDMPKRMADLKTGIPFDHDVTWRFRVRRSAEKHVHRLLKPYQHKREWYRDCNQVQDFLEDLYDFQFLTACRIADGDNTMALDIIDSIDVTEAVMSATIAPPDEDDEN